MSVLWKMLGLVVLLSMLEYQPRGLGLKYAGTARNVGISSTLASISDSAIVSTTGSGVVRGRIKRQGRGLSTCLYIPKLRIWSPQYLMHMVYCPIVALVCAWIRHQRCGRGGGGVTGLQVLRQCCNLWSPGVVDLGENVSVALHL